jgi:hypothetical protein
MMLSNQQISARNRSFCLPDNLSELHLSNSVTERETQIFLPIQWFFPFGIDYITKILYLLLRFTTKIGFFYKN